MPPITFGSVGDIIAVSQIARSLVRALNDAKGSAKEYQELLKELQAFDQAILQVVALWQNYDDSPELQELGTIVKGVIEDWRHTLLAFRLKVDKKYGTSLNAGGSGYWLKDICKKVKWLKEKEDVINVRRKLQTASGALTMLIPAAIGHSNRLTSTAIAVRVESVHGLVQESTTRAENHMAKLKRMAEKLDCQGNTINKMLNSANSKDCEVSCLEQLRSVAMDIESTVSLFRGHILAQTEIPRGIGTHWKQEPVTLEDALGFLYPIPLELVNSWDFLHIILTQKFEKHPGHGKIQRREYAIEDGSSGKELSRTTEFSICMHPGQKIDMSVVFIERSANDDHCPRCGSNCPALSEARFQCTSCNMWVQRITRIDDNSEDTSGLGAEIATCDSDGKSRTPLQQSRDSILSPADFQRVRMLRKLQLQAKNKHSIPLVSPGVQKAGFDGLSGRPLRRSRDSSIKPADFQTVRMLRKLKLQAKNKHSIPPVEATIPIAVINNVRESKKQVSRTVKVWFCHKCGDVGNIIYKQLCACCGHSKCPACLSGDF